MNIFIIWVNIKLQKIVDPMKLQIKTILTLSFSLTVTFAFATGAATSDTSNKATPLQVVGEWKIYKSDETNYNSCTARNSNFMGVTLNEQKLVVSLQETKDLKSYQISVNNQSVVPESRANLVDTTCNCLRVRNIKSLNVDDAVIRIQGQNNQDKPVDKSMTLKNIPAVLLAFKSPACAR